MKFESYEWKGPNTKCWDVQSGHPPYKFIFLTNKKLLLFCSTITKGLMMRDCSVQSFSGEGSEYILTDSDYLTLRKGEEMPLLGGVKTDWYLKARIFRNHCIWGSMLDDLLLRHPNIQELHCMLSATPVFYIDHDYSYANERKYAPLRFNVSGISKRPGPYQWIRAQMVDGSLLPWYCLASKPYNPTAEEIEIKQQVAHDLAQDLFLGDEKLVYAMDLTMVVHDLIINTLTYSLTDANLFHAYSYLDGDRKLIAGKVDASRQLILQRQQALFAEHKK